MDTIIKEKSLRNPEQDAWRYVKALRKKAKGNLLENLGNDTKVYQHVVEQNYMGNLRAWYDDKGTLVGLLMFAVAKPWWSDKNAVFEETVFCLDETYSGIQREAIRELERIARANDAEMVFAGDILCDERTSPLVLNGYRKAGFKPIATDLVKILEYNYE